MKLLHYLSAVSLRKLKFPPIFRKTNKAKSGHDEKSEYNTGNNSDEDVTLDGITGKSPQLKVWLNAVYKCCLRR